MLGAMTADSLIAPGSASIGVERLRGAEALTRLTPEWERLAGASADPMQMPAWILAAAKNFHPGRELSTVAIRRGAELVAVLALVETRRAGMRCLEIPGAAALGEPLRPVVADAAARAALAQALLSLRGTLLLPRVDDAEFAAQLRVGAKGRAILISMAGGACLAADLGTPESVMERCSPARRKVLRRNLKSLEREGAVRFEHISPAPDDVEATLRAAFEVEARSWKGEAGSAVLTRADLAGFFRDYGRASAARCRLLVRRLWAGERVAAVQVAVIEGGRCFDLKIGYDGEFARHSPGLTLTCEALADDARRGLRGHEFLGLAEDWQRAFATRERRCESFVIYPLNAPGLAAFAFDAAGAIARRARRALGMN
jgi:CelD/BcsL family acetyltransferase involved in cellulose biosynthesis